MGEDSARLGAGQHAGLRILLIAGEPGGTVEVDLGDRQIPVEVKSGMTVASDAFGGLA
jgi:hypothetical protein